MRRRPVVFAALAALVLAPPAFAHAAAQPSGACPAPEVVRDYDTRRIAVHATLVASGCPAREHRQFRFSAFVSRDDENSGSGHARAVFCGPFRSSSDMEPGEPTTSYRCDVDLAVPHAPTEAAHYRVEVTYPGPKDEETVAFDTFCVSNEQGASCVEDTH